MVDQIRGKILTKQSHISSIFESSSESALLVVEGDFNVEKILSIDSKRLSMLLPFNAPPPPRAMDYVLLILVYLLLPLQKLVMLVCACL
jgi:hypothetical protein